MNEEILDNWQLEKKPSNRGARGPRPKKYKVSSSTGYKGVYVDGKDMTRKNPYVAQLSFWKPDGKTQITVHLGCFPTAEEAHKARVLFITDLL